MKCPHCGQSMRPAMSKAGPVMRSVFARVKMYEPQDVFRPSDINIGQLGTRMQLYNALHELVRQGILQKAGYGKFKRGNAAITS